MVKRYYRVRSASIMAALLNDRNELLFSASNRVTGASVSITPGAATSVIFPKNSTTPVPTAVTLTANLSGYVVPSFAWSYRFGNTGDFTAIAQTTNPVTVNWNTAFYTAAAASTLVQYKVAVQETTSNLGINQAEFVLSVPIIREGSDGARGINNVVVRLFQRTANNAAPDVATTGNSTYTFTTGQVVGEPTGWTQAIPSTSDSFPYIWMIETVAASAGLSYQFANTLWTAPILFTQNGIPGVPGTNTATVFAYKRSASLPTDNPGAVSYSFSSNSITTATLANSWSKTIPTGTDTIYITAATAASTGASDTIESAEWSTAVKFVENATNSATVFLYARNNNSSTAPDLIRTGEPTYITYNFTSGAITGTLPAGWIQAMPDIANGSVLWAVQANAINTNTSDTIANTEWSTPRVLSVNGTNGVSGTSVYVATVYLQSASLPSTPSATASTYNFATNVLTPPAGWSVSQPATTTTPTYACDYTFSGAPGATVTGTGNWSTPYIEAVNGTNGAAGEYRDIIQLYLISATVPTAPTSVPYTFSTNAIGTQTGGTAGWSLTRPSATTTPTYVITALAASTTPAVAVTLTTWSTPVIAAQIGTNGVSGTSVYVATVYLQSASLPSTPSATASTYNFATNVLTPPAGWSVSQPATTTTPTYACDYTFSGAPGATVTGTGNWSTPYIEAVNGTNGAAGEYRDIIQLYLISATVPTAPTSVPYTFSTNAIGTQTGGTAGWSLTRPSATTTPTYVITALAASTTPAVAVTLTTWSTPVIAAQIGTNGTNGTRGTRQLYFNNASYTSTYQYLGNTAGAVSYAAAATALIASTVAGTIPTTPIKGDTVTFSNSTDFVYTITYNSDTTQWEPPGTVIDGSLLVTGSVTAAKINSNGLSIKSVDGLTTILSAGVPLDFSNVGGTTKPANNATVGAQAGVNLKDSSGTVIDDDGFRNNLIDVGWWQRGATIPWGLNGEQNFIYSTTSEYIGSADITDVPGPKGGSDVIWYCKEITGNGESGGGWNAAISSTLDPNKTYRFVVPIRFAEQFVGGTAYWGTQNVCDLNTTTLNTNPYFAVKSRGQLSFDRWYLFVGYVFPYNSTNNSNISAGIWDCKTGIKVGDGTNYCHATTGANIHRAYQYYADLDAVQYFGRPMINLVDGTEPSLREYFESSAVLNQNITVDSQGRLENIGTPFVVVANNKITVDNDGILQGTGTGSVVVSNNKITVDGSTGVLQGTGTAGVKVDNTKITVDGAGLLQGAGTVVSVANNQDSIIRAPGGGFLTTTSSSSTGAIKIRLPVYFANSMIRMTVEVFVFSEARMFTCEIGGYMNPSSSSWSNTSAKILGNPNDNFPVRFGHDGTKSCVWIGNHNTTWAYPQVRVRDVFIGYSDNVVAQWSTGWTISFDAVQKATGTGANQYSSQNLNTAINAANINALATNAASVLGAVLSTNATTVAGLRAGDLVWDTSGTRTSGRGVALTQNGIVGHNGTKTTFAIDATTGNATFGGTLDAADGTFSGTLSATAIFGGTLDAASGTFKGTLTADAVNAVSTINIGANQVTIPSTAYTAGGIGVGTSYVAVQTVTINVLTGTPVVILATFFADAPCRPRLAIRRNGVIIYEMTTFYALGAFAGTLTWPSTIMTQDTTIVDGAQTYEFLINTQPNYGFNASMRSLTVFGAKR